MQSIIDKLQTPQSFAQSVQELVIALQRTGDPGNLSVLRLHLELLAAIDPSPGMFHSELLACPFVYVSVCQ
jgi:RING finger/CCCH-type zinc finger protein